MDKTPDDKSCAGSLSTGTLGLDAALKADAEGRLDTALKKIDAKNPTISDEEIGKEIKAHRRETRKRTNRMDV